MPMIDLEQIRKLDKYEALRYEMAFGDSYHPKRQFVLLDELIVEIIAKTLEETTTFLEDIELEIKSYRLSNHNPEGQ